ncbi:TRAP transporter substrate-binding protein DctP [Rhodospira trueperi]|uniref:TRAP-type mannitol/chloroaromatic compound transport system, substrate-binding protein n=1 Tax=Rhodospira trueperi TaxID=69960 RepID=A0A1G7B0C4_9PROT|nr:TRAP transporter substrate-binding protein DctP [Rhodospira trueperi]SDE20297.1 TRAP-type mannitol/chloroaromatic compound transport system, substrate-binding protein [Rhodospira trueperi]
MTQRMMEWTRPALVAGALAMGAAALPAQAADFEFRMAIISSENSIYYQDMAKPFADLVADLTDGRVAIEILPAGTVGSVLKLHDAVSDGLIDMAQTTPIFLGTSDLVNAMVASFPTGLGVDSYLPWLYEGGGLELWQEHRREKMGMHALVTSLGPSEFFAHANEPIRNADDLEGKKFRTLGNWAAIVEENYGASPTVVAGSEIYGMLEKGGIDMAEYSIPSENAKIGFHEVAKYIIYPGIQAPSWAFETVMLTETWDSLPEDIQRKMELAAELTTYRSLNAMITRDLETMEELQAGGNEFVRLDEAFMEDAQEKSRAWAMRLAEEAAASGDDLPMRLAESVFSFQDHWRANSKYLVIDHRP